MRNIIFVFVIFSSFIFAQQTKISKEKSRLENIKNEIKKLENELNSLNKDEQNSLKALTNYNKQILSYSKIIVRLKTEESIKSLKLKQTQDSIKLIDDSIRKLKMEYANYIKWLYMFGLKEKINYLLTSKSVSQAFARYKYFSYITKKNEKILEKLVLNRQVKNLLQNTYKVELLEREKLIKQKLNEQKNLAAKKNDKLALIAKLRKDKNNVYTEIDLKQKSEIRIKDLIAKLENEELEREKRELEKKIKNKNYKPAEKNLYSGLSDFYTLNGKLPWPVNSRKIVRNFGENVNPNLNTVTLNYGIDIKTGQNENVYAVADGLVSAIEWIPGYGSVIIITHKENFRTVYGHVTELDVEVGSKVKSGQSIGKVNDSLEGSILHFEIWNKRIYQNPEEWLARK